MSRSTRVLRGSTAFALAGFSFAVWANDATAFSLKDFGSPGGFVAKNVPVFKQGTKEHQDYFAAQFPNGCTNPNPPNPPEQPVEPEPPRPPVPNPIPNPPVPKPNPRNPDGTIITPRGDPGGEIIIELIDAVGEVDGPISGFDPLNEQQVVDVFSGNDVIAPPVADAPLIVPPAAAAPAIVPPPAVTPPPTTFTATDSLGPPPDTAYFNIDEATGALTVLPAAPSELQAGTDNATTGFFFPVTPYQFENPPIAPGLSATFTLGTFTATIRNTATGDRFSVSVTVTLTGVSISVTKL